ncbi:sensor histidine kinase [Bacillus lacus]|uniref:histidine kinase n=2 Tax=Metabacillus lacus TaxID=1983721 RepID=A0A7X2J3J5_9BACI|nr:sensor histidine kinase [Metabacillus lacus]
MFVFVGVMAIVLLLVGAVTFNSVADLLVNNAETQIQETALQTNGRMESLFEQVDMLSKQVATNSSVQSLLQRTMQGETVAYQDKQSLVQLTNMYEAYSNGITSFEIYTNNTRRIIPIDDASLRSRISDQWISKADEAKGKLVWIGRDSQDPQYFLAIRRISLIDRWFSKGGYLLMRIDESYFQITEDPKQQYMIVLDDAMNPVASNYYRDIGPIVDSDSSRLELNKNEYMMVKRTSQTNGWTVLILTPVSSLMEGVSALRNAVLFSAMIGFIFFMISSYFLSTLITKPLFRLTKAMKAANNGKLSFNHMNSSTIEIKQLNDTYNQLVEQTNHLIQVVYEKELIRSRTELKALQAQIDPHFLFNTLNSLYWSLEEKGEDELAQQVIAMSDLFRYTITNSSSQEWVTLKQERDHIERYMQIMKMRFGDRFTGKIEVNEEFFNVKIPKLLIQPLVENAIVHGIRSQTGTGFVKVLISPSYKNGRLRVEVADNGAGIDEPTIQQIYESMESGNYIASKGTGMAIGNVHKRLKLYYEEEGIKGIAITSRQNEGTSVIFEIPAKRGADHESENNLNCG